jgi:hypothetical protein
VALILYEDNEASIAMAMAMAQKPTPRTHHMDIKYHILIKWVERDLLQLKCINTSINLADHFTKQLVRTLFHCYVDYKLGKVPPTYSCAFSQFKLVLPLPEVNDQALSSSPLTPVLHTYTSVMARLWTCWSRIIVIVIGPLY